MTPSLAGASQACSALLARSLTPVARARPANDNGAGGPGEAMLHAALRHFAEHGLAAAQQARREAEAASCAGDLQGYHWWLEICRTLDRRLASAVERRGANA